jgi:hypothetical protein
LLTACPPVAHDASVATTLTSTFPSSGLVLLPRPGDVRRRRAGMRVRGARLGSARSRLRDIALLVSAFGMLAGLLLTAAPAHAAGPPPTTITTGQTPLVLGYLPLTPDGAGGTPCDVKTLEGCEHAATIVAAINATPCTGRITATFYSFSIDAYADALVAREKCGTDLHILTWHGVDEDGKVIKDSDPLRRVQAAVKKYGNGWYKSCRYSCYDTRAEGTMHMKEWLFSSTGGQSNVGTPPATRRRTCFIWEADFSAPELNSFQLTTARVWQPAFCSRTTSVVGPSIVTWFMSCSTRQPGAGFLIAFSRSRAAFCFVGATWNV